MHFWRISALRIRRPRAMLDFIFLVIGVLLIALMGVYADACRRL
ncbi:MAG TPA: hypothetical protein VGY52_11175 [Roseiarcus sp.]|jgi:hypothetical protein|nr:hypothetical protein [Roseiarcus sp.]